MNCSKKDDKTKVLIEFMNKHHPEMMSKKLEAMQELGDPIQWAGT